MGFSLPGPPPNPKQQPPPILCLINPTPSAVLIDVQLTLGTTLLDYAGTHPAIPINVNQNTSNAYQIIGPKEGINIPPVSDGTYWMIIE